jgi:hypothetical protein
MHDPPLLGHVLPHFAAQLESALKAEHPGLASQIRELRIGRVCSCDDPGCATFDVPDRRPSDYDYSVVLEDLGGLVLVDLAKRDRIRSRRAGAEPRVIGIEVLGRPDLREQLDADPDVAGSPGEPS